MRFVVIIVAASLFGIGTTAAYVASVAGWGLPGLMDKPISTRQSSVSGRRRRGPGFIYFGSPLRRRHFGGGFRGGK